MDGQRFDSLARAVAGGASRRLVIRGFAAGVMATIVGVSRGSPVGAQQNVPLGGRCSTFGANSECSQAGTPAGGVAVICSDNGVALDGQFNCCRNAGGVCTADFHCCGSAACQNGTCGGSRAPSAGPGTSPLGANCTSTSQCSQAGGSVVCSDNGISTDGALNCCRSQGGACIAGSNCCSGLACINSVCGGTSGSANLSPGTACNSTGECSQAGGSVVCADNGVATDGALNCCRAAGGGCSSSAGCCAGLQCVSGACSGAAAPPTSGNLARGSACTAASECSQAGGAVLCSDNGYVDDGPLNCCRSVGGACTDTVRSADCCLGLYCRNGACTDLSLTGQLPPGSACDSADQCDQTGGGVDCAFNGEVTRGATNCCRYGGGACTTKAGCCGEADCINGVCGGAAPAAGGLTPGASCTSSSQCGQGGGTTICADNGIASDGALNCCRNAGGACTNGAGCCAGLLCTNGTCGGGGASGAPGPGGGELPPGSTCTADSQCSQAGGEVVCQDNGIASDGVLNCCRYVGACTAANNSAGCCAGRVCVGGTCQVA
ncbi:MAG: hypothetical protein M3509_06295 [Chloroflexota bacterium]|nr:hypothetical protein [Chloroflexota bacterium]